MLLIFIGLAVAIAESSELDKENAELRLSNEILHKQLMELSRLGSMPLSVLDDFEYNKQKLAEILDEFSEKGSKGMRIQLAEQIQYYLSILLEDLAILGQHEDVLAVDVESCNKHLSGSIEQYKLKQQNQEFTKAYNELKSALTLKDETLKLLQIENAKLIGRLDNSLADLEQASQTYDHSSKRLESLYSELASTRTEQALRLENLKASLQTEEQTSRSKEIEDFNKIQSSQDELILKLEDKNAEQTIKIEKLSMDKVNLNAKLRLLNSTIERLTNEISARNEQLLVSEKKFEEFRREIEYETNDEIISLRNSEEVLKTEVNALQDKQMALLESITECNKGLDALEMEKRQKENLIKELELSIQEARESIQSAKEGRGQEIAILVKSLEESEAVIEVLQGQLEEALLKISAQNAVLRELNDQLEEFKFLTQNVENDKGFLRGFNVINI